MPKYPGNEISLWQNVPEAKRSVDERSRDIDMSQFQNDLDQNLNDLGPKCPGGLNIRGHKRLWTEQRLLEFESLGIQCFNVY